MSDTDVFKQGIYFTVVILTIGALSIFFFHSTYQEINLKDSNAYSFVRTNNSYKLVERTDLNFSKDKAILIIALEKAEIDKGEVGVKGSVQINLPSKLYKNVNNGCGNISFETIWTTKKYDDVGPFELDVAEKEDSGFIFAFSNDFLVYPFRGSLLRYPFDQFNFDIPVLTRPSIKFDIVEIINRTVYEIKTSPKITTLDNTSLDEFKHLHDKNTDVELNPAIRIEYKFSRKKYLFIAFYSIAAAILIFIVLTILHINRIDTILTSIAGYFFSVWSARNIVIQDIQVFPTLLDILIFYSSSIFLALVVLKIAFGYYQRSE